MISLNLIVERVSKIIELKDMTIVRYRNPLTNHYVYRAYVKGDYRFTAFSYIELLDNIAVFRLFNE